MIDIDKALHYVNDPSRPRGEALRKVLGDAWDEGYEAGEFREHNYGRDSGADYPANPYRASEGE